MSTTTLATTTNEATEKSKVTAFRPRTEATIAITSFGKPARAGNDGATCGSGGRRT
jgi:hypothetical protein